MKKFWKYTLYTLLGIFAAIGLVFTGVFLGLRFGLFNVQGSASARNQSITGTASTPATVAIKVDPCTDATEKTCAWDATPEWQTIEGGLQKDAALIDQAGAATGVDPRMIAAVVVPEQTRFFTANREIFKSYFEPLKILGSLTQFSLGISGIKQQTADMIELNANDPSSAFYPGDGFAALIAYPAGASHDSALYARLTDTKNHYYQYLYTAIFIKEVESQWQRAGFDISQNPEAIVTLFNIGFQNSHPKADPEPGGADITTGGTVYTYGALGGLFYRSTELMDIFPAQ